MTQTGWPETVKEAADRFVERLSEEDKEYMRNHSRRDDVHMWIIMGRSIRNDFGLWQGNKKLMEDAKREHPDDASAIILDMVWDMVNPDDQTKFVKEEDYLADLMLEETKEQVDGNF
jgi:hypothetical protein